MKTKAEKQAGKDIWLYIRTQPGANDPFIDQWYVTPKYVINNESRFLNEMLNLNL